jgi:phosphate transport system substrate-binding protein
MQYLLILVSFVGMISCSFLGMTGENSSASRQVLVDGSSTVYPVTEAVAEKFGKTEPRVRVSVGVSGTGGGFRKLLSGETDINNASRRIKDKEQSLADENGVNLVELPIAYDGLSVVVHKDNDFIDYLSLKELQNIWMPGSTVKTWSDVRAGWPAKAVKLYGPGPDSGTFDYFTKRVNGKSGASRPDYTASEDDNVIVKGVQADKYSLGYFGYAYYLENKQKLRAVPIQDGAKKAVSPQPSTISSGKYPISRPLFLYVNSNSLKKPAVMSFVRFYLANAESVMSRVGYVAIPSAERKLSEALVEKHASNASQSNQDG